MIAISRAWFDAMLVGVIALLASALALKVVRYDGERPDDPAIAMQRIEQTLVRHGWSRTATEAFAEGMPLYAATFAKSGCPATTVTLLGHKSELKHYVSGLHDGDVQFRHDHDAPRDRILGFGKVKPLALIAVAPSPKDTPCAVTTEN